MNRSPGHATGNNADVLPARLEPDVALPTPAEHLATAAADLLGWQGVVLPALTLFGRRVIPVAELIHEAHAERLCLGYAPVVDRASVETWVWPELTAQVPPPAVRIAGMLSLGRHWRTGLASVAPFARFCGAAVVLPDGVLGLADFQDNCLPRAQRHDVTVLTATVADDRLDVAQSAWPELVDPTVTVTGLWLNEVVYERMLAE
ncbi:hypothetical protein FHR81_003895 [Actinoalloteichus hoggarensis]|uniref:Uncharacterized protein n=1 Tax=Actinoalloteichus hoggarensis TaxID=1470176 RepID=A0A221VVY7_9PSEU|nr:hypothetical protein [Actinoalloteichus hoggarensis]ASO17712.1 hypothetical protein AHOG_00185 [Actinoalloteichus hoggarensis]MBB5922838.1 hypothetical protein [Actinoalloteichus hoggarensis]